MARYTPPIVANTDFQQWQSWETITTPDGSTTYYVIPGYNGQYVFDPYTSDATGQITIYNNPKPAYDAAAKAQKQQEEANSTSSQAAQIGGTVAGAGVTAATIDLVKNGSESMIGGLFSTADKVNQGTNLATGGQALQSGSNATGGGSSVGGGFGGGTAQGAQVAQHGTQTGATTAQQVAPQVAREGAQAAQTGTQTGNSVYGINTGALVMTAAVLAGQFAERKLKSRNKFMSEAQAMASNAIKKQVPGWSSMSTGQRRAILNKAAELGLLQGLYQHKTTVEHFNNGKGLDDNLQNNAYFGFSTAESKFSEEDYFRKQLTDSKTKNPEFNKQYAVRKLLPGMGIAELAELHESGALEGVDIPGVPKDPSEWDRISELNGFIEEVKGNGELAGMNVQPDTRDLSEVAKGQEAKVYEIENLNELLFSDMDLRVDPSNQIQGNLGFWMGTLPGMVESKRAEKLGNNDPRLNANNWQETNTTPTGNPLHPTMGAGQVRGKEYVEPQASEPMFPDAPQQPQQPQQNARTAEQPPMAVQRPTPNQMLNQQVPENNVQQLEQPKWKEIAQHVPQQDLPTYQEGVGPGTYKHPDGVNRVTVDQNGNASQTLIGTVNNNQSEEDKIRDLFADMLNGNIQKGKGKQPNVFS